MKKPSRFKLTKAVAKQRLGFKTDVELADFFGIGRWAVTQWGEREIPKLRQVELHHRRPDLFVMPSLGAGKAA